MNSPRPTTSHRSRGFTLLEVLLATLLAGMVVIAAISLFATLDRSHRRHEVRMQRALETAVAQRALQTAFSSLLMNEGAEPREDDVEKLRDEDRRRGEGPDALRFDDRAVESRFALQPSDPEMGGAMIDNHPSQLFAVTLRSRPVAGNSDPNPGDSSIIIDEHGRVLTGEESQARTSRSRLSGGLETLAARRSARMSSRAAVGTGTTGTSSVQTSDEGSLSRGTVRAGDNEQKNDSGATFRGGNESPAGALETLSNNSSGLNSAPGLEGIIDPGRAPGVRGVFEILPDDPATPVGSSIVGTPASGATEETGVALWWRELPPVITQSAASGTDQSTLEQQAMQVRRMQLMGSGSRRVKLLGGLRSAGFTVLRNEKQYTKMSAKWAGELPAHIEFSFETLAGTKEDWMFEVAWAVGPEPGSPISATGATNVPSNLPTGSGLPTGGPPPTRNGGGGSGPK